MTPIRSTPVFSVTACSRTSVSTHYASHYVDETWKYFYTEQLYAMTDAGFKPYLSLFESLNVMATSIRQKRLGKPPLKPVNKKVT